LTEYKPQPLKAWQNPHSTQCTHISLRFVHQLPAVRNLLGGKILRSKTVGAQVPLVDGSRFASFLLIKHQEQVGLVRDLFGQEKSFNF